MHLTPYVENLRRDLAVAAEAGGEEARAAAERVTAPLESAVRLMLYEALLGYTYLGGCGETIVNLGPAPNRLALSERLLREACSHFARAGRHFTGAVEGGRTDLLSHAVAEALTGWRMLPRATEALARR